MLDDYKMNRLYQPGELSDLSAFKINDRFIISFNY